MTTSDWIISLNGAAILIAPIVALQIRRRREYGSMVTGPGCSIREERRRDLLIEVVKTVKLRTLPPTFLAENMHVEILERIQKRAVLEEEFDRSPPSLSTVAGFAASDHHAANRLNQPAQRWETAPSHYDELQGELVT
jgi:hypothetical protein